MVDGKVKFPQELSAEMYSRRERWLSPLSKGNMNRFTGVFAKWILSNRIDKINKGGTASQLVL